MDFLSSLVLILLTLVAYSAGSVLAGRGYKLSPGVSDLLIVIMLWIVALTSRARVGKWWAILIGLLVGGVVGAAVMLIQRKLGKLTPIKAKAATAETDVIVQGSLWKRLWTSWKVFAAELGDFQGRVLLIWFYFIIVTPFGLLVRLFSDPLRIKYQNLCYYQLYPLL